MRFPKASLILVLPAVLFVLLYGTLNLVFIGLTDNHSIPLQQSIQHKYEQAGENLTKVREHIETWHSDAPAPRAKLPLDATDSTGFCNPEEVKLIRQKY